MPVTATPGNDFVPADVTINVGDSVTWTNSGGDHNVVFEDGMFTVPANAEPPSAWPALVARTFTAPGDFAYYCAAHRLLGMTGVVRVAQSVPAPGPAPPPPGGPGPSPDPPEARRTPFQVTLRVSDPTPTAGSRVRFFGSVRPAGDGGLVLIQRRVRPGEFRTVARTRLKDAAGARSTYGVRVRIRRDGAFRARVPGSGDHAAGLSRTRLVNVHS